MSPVEYRTILKYHLMIPLFPVDEICPVCRKTCLDSFGEHAVHCKELPGFKYRHDMVRDVLFDVCRRARISAKKEAPLNTGKILVDKFHSKLFSWKTSLLSFGGRLTLIKAVLGSLGSQGSKRLAWMKWSNILASFDKGDSLWVKVIRALHGSEGGFDHNGCRFNGLWSRIVGSSNYLHSSSILPMDSIRFQALSVGTREEFSDYRSYSQWSMVLKLVSKPWAVTTI
ncbi:hypothetical protein Tco_0822107 [Tanacetum coccineum]|uniref:Reverse transcriptase zinc-binding domain-containing protein n=1 Tax=Tanacetum coccineum TaxID=301880 RepID=A0ABQ5AF27_9ASTR